MNRLEEAGFGERGWVLDVFGGEVALRTIREGRRCNREREMTAVVVVEGDGLDMLAFGDEEGLASKRV